MNSLIKKLTAFFTRTSPDNPKPTPLPLPKFWEVSSPKDYIRFLQLLPELIPFDSTLYLEGTAIPQDVREYLNARPAQSEMAIPRGTIWPKPQCFHMPLTSENITGLVEFFDEHHVDFEICSHLHAYLNGQMYLIWYDALSFGPKEFLYLSQKIPEENVRELCQELGCTYADSEDEDGVPPFLFDTLKDSS